MKWITLGAVLVFAWGAQTQARAEDYPQEVQRALGDAFRKAAAQQLEHVAERYNRGLTDRSGLSAAAKAAGMSAQAISELSSKVAFEGALPKATWADDQLTIRDSGVTITMSVADFMNRTMRINGKPFAWNARASVADNLKAYDEVFQSAQGSAHAQSWLPDLVPSAWAQDWVAIKAAGLKLYFEVSDVGEAGGQLDRVNEHVKSLVDTCKSSGATAQGKDDFLNSVMDATMRAYGEDSEPTVFKNCADVRAYANSHVQTVTYESLEQEDFPYRLPADLCKNLDRLAKCTRQLMSPTSSTTSRRKATPSDEWHDSEPAARKAGAAR